MRSTELRRVFRHVLAMTFVTPIAAGACGGVAIEDIDQPNGGGPSSPTSPTPSGGKNTSGSGTTDASVVIVDSGPPKKDAGVLVDASKPDVAVKDAAVDVPCVDLPAPPPHDGGFPTCDWTVPLPCGINPDAGSIPYDVCQTHCGQDAMWCYVANFGTGGGDDFDPVLQCVSCAIGRRPEGYVGQTTHDCETSAIGRYFAIAAELEAASVFSFERLERELSVYGAPAELRRRARRAANDERRHARVTQALAERHGGRATMPTSGPMDARHLDAIALENAVEGCVRETFGALVATVQAARATDPRVRAAMERIAADETDHAALAWSVARWMNAQLDDDARAQIQSALARAIETLAREVSIDPPPELQRVAGLPSGAESRALVDGLRETLWAA